MIWEIKSHIYIQILLFLGLRGIRCSYWNRKRQFLSCGDKRFLSLCCLYQSSKHSFPYYIWLNKQRITFASTSYYSFGFYVYFVIEKGKSYVFVISDFGGVTCINHLNIFLSTIYEFSKEESHLHLLLTTPWVFMRALLLKKECLIFW